MTQFPFKLTTIRQYGSTQTLICMKTRIAESIFKCYKYVELCVNMIRESCYDYDRTFGIDNSKQDFYTLLYVDMNIWKKVK